MKVGRLYEPFPSVAEVKIFGSRATDNARRASDEKIAREGVVIYPE